MISKESVLVLILHVLAGRSNAFCSSGWQNSFVSSRKTLLSSKTHIGTTLTMYLHASEPVVEEMGVNTDFATLGTLKVSSVAIQIPSRSKNGFLRSAQLSLETIVLTAGRNNAAFFHFSDDYGCRVVHDILMQQCASAILHDKTQPVVATTFNPLAGHTVTPESVVQACDKLRACLGVGQLDLYQLSLSNHDKRDQIYLQGLADCYKRGWTKNVGICCHDPDRLFNCHEFLTKQNIPLASNQCEFSLTNRSSQGTLDLCRQLGIACLVSDPLAGGLLDNSRLGALSSNGFAAEQAFYALTKVQSTHLNTDAGSTGQSEERRNDSEIAPLLAVMAEIAEMHSKTVTQVALNHVICKNGIPLAEARTSEQVGEHNGAVGWRLTPEEIQLLETVADSLAN